MLNDKIKGEWRTKVKTIFTEAQKKFAEEEEANGLDLGGDPGEDPAADVTPVDDAAPVDPTAGAVPGEEEEPEPTITVTASLLKALLDYASAPEEDSEVSEVPVDDTLPIDPVAPVAEVSAGNPSMTAPSMTTNTGVMENALPPVPEAPVAPEGEAEVDDALAGGEVDGDLPVDGEVEGDDVSTDEIVQRLIDLSADANGEPLDVDVLAVVFSPEGDEGEDLGGGELDGNVELPATTGPQTVPPTAPAPVPVV